ncbi:ATP-binding protein [Halomonas sp. ATCH28]|uniref:ATP-binding protein n=1 Tax=Halomonas gemina TaxID=2945105 RepID=A0ABT0T336_9GAMM|nr:ATP-binding protein [Halomonas gemina]MCL7941197.1 ATP-binding protein [Halomonas gemina]
MSQPMTTTPEVRSHLANVLAGKAETRGEHCRAHGSYSATLMPNGQWSGCPDCLEEEKSLQRQAEQRERAGQASNAKLEQLREGSMIPARFQARSLEDFETEGRRDKAFALAACQRYVERFDDRLAQGGGMVITGSVGAGKSHLAYGIGNALLAQGRRVMGIDVYELIDLIKERAFSREKGASEREAIKAFVAGLDLLILDEIGAQLGTEWERLMLFKIINERYKAQLPTILISNIDAAALGDYLGERIVDRMEEGGGMTLTLDWGSYRSRPVPEKHLSALEVLGNDHHQGRD